jgi:GntR family transcriptional regulator/MocR family aminotransferase
MPLRRQLSNQIREAIRDGRFDHGTRLPSSRWLSAELGVSRGVVTDAYAQLAAEGYVKQRQGSAPRVQQIPRGGSPNAVALSGNGNTGSEVLELVGTVPDLGLFPRREWMAALRQSLAGIPDQDLSYGDPRGLPILRERLASYLNRVRGVAASAERIVMTHGYTQGLSLACRVLARHGASRVAVENPGDDDQREVIKSAGLTVVPCRVDDDGLVIENVIARDVDVVVVTPAHQFPTGVVLPPERRSELVDWAASCGGTIIEDDYDSAYRYDRDPVGNLQGLSPERCIQIGSVSKLLAPTLRLGWMVAPAELTASIARERWATDAGHRAIDQWAFAAFIDSGDLDRHLRRTRRVYRRRRDLLVEALRREIPDAEIAGIEAGVHLVLRLPPGTDEEEVCMRLAAEKIVVRGMASYMVGGRPDYPALVIGYGSLADASITSVVRTVAAAIHTRND